MLKVFLMVFVLLVSGIGAAAQDDGRLARSELRYLEGMSDHHQMALDMAEDCLKKAPSDAVREICEAVITAQSAEIEQLRVWIKDWYGVDYTVIPMVTDSAEADPHAGHGMNHSPAAITDPAMTMGMFAGFNRLEGADYEVAWLESMIDHHDDALHMSERLLERGTIHPELAAFAEGVITAQTAEIAAMEALLETY